MSKILVTGGAGFIGSHLVDALIEKKHTVAILDNFKSGNRANLNPQAKLYEISILDPKVDAVFAAEKFDYVFHHAAQVSVVESLADSIEDAEINILGSLRMIECSRRHKVKKFIYANSGGARTGEPQYLPVDEKHPAAPLSPYGISKHTTEHYLYMYKVNQGFPYTILSYGNVYGPRQDAMGEAGVIAIFTKKMLEGQRPTIFGDGKQTRDFVYVKDLVRANLLALDKGEGEMFNVGTGVGATVNEIFAALKKATGFQQEVVYAPARTGEMLHTHMNIGHIKKILGWAPEYNLERGIQETVDSFRNPQKK